MRAPEQEPWWWALYPLSHLSDSVCAFNHHFSERKTYRTLSFKFFYKYTLVIHLFMCMYMCLHVSMRTSVWLLKKFRKGHKIPGARDRGSCEPPTVGSGKLTLVFCRSSSHSYASSHLSSSNTGFKIMPSHLILDYPVLGVFKSPWQWWCIAAVNTIWLSGWKNKYLPHHDGARVKATCYLNLYSMSCSFFKSLLSFHLFCCCCSTNIY